MGEGGRGHVQDLVLGHTRLGVAHRTAGGRLEGLLQRPPVADRDDREAGLPELVVRARTGEQHLVPGGPQGLGGRHHREEVARRGRAGEEYAHSDLLIVLDWVVPRIARGPIRLPQTSTDERSDLFPRRIDNRTFGCPGGAEDGPTARLGESSGAAGGVPGKGRALSARTPPGRGPSLLGTRSGGTAFGRTVLGRTVLGRTVLGRTVLDRTASGGSAPGVGAARPARDRGLRRPGGGRPRHAASPHGGAASRARSRTGRNAPDTLGGNDWPSAGADGARTTDRAVLSHVPASMLRRTCRPRTEFDRWPDHAPGRRGPAAVVVPGRSTTGPGPPPSGANSTDGAAGRGRSPTPPRRRWVRARTPDPP